MIKFDGSIIQRTMSLTEEELFQTLPNIEDAILQKTKHLQTLITAEDNSVLQSVTLRKNPANGELTYPKYDKKSCYYQEFWKIFLLNEILISQVKDFSSLNKALTIEINEIQELQTQWTRIQVLKNKKKMRRTADMIDKIHICPFQKCGKNYGTDVSLNLHMKLKHNSGTKTQRQALAKQICIAQQKGQLDKLEIYLTFPPGYLQDYRQNIYRLGKF